MTIDLNEITVFIEVVKQGSFSGAGKKLNLPNSTVSFKVSSLEKRLGTTLIQRTTRKLSVTPAGQAFYKRCLLGLEEIQSAEQELAMVQKEPQGLLRITAPLELSSSVLPSLIKDYVKKFPKTKVEVLLSDRVLDLLIENVDLAIRAGELADSSLIAKRIGTVHFILVATPKYLKTTSAPKHPRDLWDHTCLQFTPMGYQEWKLVSNKGGFHTPVPGKIVINDLAAIKNLTLLDAGIALLPYHFCFSEIHSGRLTQVLPAWQTKGNPIHFVYPAQRFVTPKLSSFMKMAQDSLKTALS